MKKTRVILALLLAFVMLFSFVACGGDTADDSKDQQQQVQIDQDTDDQSDEDEGIQTDQEKEDQTSGDSSAQQQTPADNDQDAQKDEPKAPTAADAKAYIGKSASSLISALGSPVSAQYSPSCMGDGEDGELVYNGFTVYTYREGGNEKVVDVA